MRLSTIPLPGGAPGETTHAVGYRRARAHPRLAALRRRAQRGWNRLAEQWPARPTAARGSRRAVAGSQRFVPARAQLGAAAVPRAHLPAISGQRPTRLSPRSRIHQQRRSGDLEHRGSRADDPGIRREPQFSARYEDWNLTTTHQVLLPGLGAGDESPPRSSASSTALKRARRHSPPSRRRITRRRPSSTRAASSPAAPTPRSPPTSLHAPASAKATPSTPAAATANSPTNSRARATAWSSPASRPIPRWCRRRARS